MTNASWNETGLGSIRQGKKNALYQLNEQGVELIVVKDLLGHAQINTTADIYATSASACNATRSKP